MYENDIYSGSGAGNNTSGTFSGNNDFGNSNSNAGSTGTNYANTHEETGSNNYNYGTPTNTYGSSANTDSNSHSNNYSYGNSNNNSYDNNNSYSNNYSYGSSNGSYGQQSGSFSGSSYGSYQTGGSTFQSDMGQGEGTKKKTRKNRGYFRKAAISLSLGLCFGLFAGVGFCAVQQAYRAVNQENAAEQVSTIQNSSAVEDEITTSQIQTSQLTYVESDVSDVVKEVMPAMVSIINNYTETGTYFGREYSQTQAASGSGIIVSETDTELLVVTNYHVIEGAETLEISFIDESTAEAKVKGTDSDMDLAVIAIDLDELSAETRSAISIAQLGDSDTLELGEPVIAIGNALGYGQSVTNGIVSALNREIALEDGSTGTFIQTNAAINPGNSGGALLNIAGEVIGINSNKIGGTAIEGMGYAIPISSASPIIAELMERQTRELVDESEMGYMGIYMQAVPSDVASLYGFPEGIFITGILEGSGAEAAGLKRQDIIVKLDGQRVTTAEELQKQMQYFAVGETVTVTVMRAENGEYVQYDLDVTLGARPTE